MNTKKRIKREFIKANKFPKEIHNLYGLFSKSGLTKARKVNGKPI